MDRQIRALKAASGDVVVVATIDTFAPYADIREYAVKMFENHGRGIGDKGKDNGLLVLLAVKDRKVWVEVGYDLEQFITDGYAGDVSRTDMAPAFARGDYGGGLFAGVSQFVGAHRAGARRDADGRAASCRRGDRRRKLSANLARRDHHADHSDDGVQLDDPPVTHDGRRPALGRRAMERLEQRRRAVRRRRRVRRRWIWRRVRRVRRRRQRRWRRGAGQVVGAG